MMIVATPMKRFVGICSDNFKFSVRLYLLTFCTILFQVTTVKSALTVGMVTLQTPRPRTVAPAHVPGDRTPEISSPTHVFFQAMVCRPV